MTDKNQDEGVEENLDLPEVEEGQEDTTDWKSEAQKLREKAISQRERTKELKSKLKAYESNKATAPTNKSNDLDFGQKAYLKSMLDIKGADELALVNQFRERGFDDLDALVEDDVFQSKLNKLRDAKAVQGAIPTGSKRGSGAPANSVDAGIAKYEKTGQLPDDIEEAGKILDRLVERERGPQSRL